MNRLTIVENADGTVTISKMCSVSRSAYMVTIPREQYIRWRSGELIQRVMPLLTKEQREFLISGTTPQEWAATI